MEDPALSRISAQMSIKCIKVGLWYLSAPNMSSALNLLNSGIPVIGRYSLTEDLNNKEYVV